MWRKKVNLFSHPTGRGVSKIFLFWPGGTGRGGGQEREYLIKTKSDVGKKTVVQQIYETYLDICFSKWMTKCSKVYSLVQLSAEVFDENI